VVPRAGRRAPHQGAPHAHTRSSADPLDTLGRTRRSMAHGRRPGRHRTCLRISHGSDCHPHAVGEA
jgi:hypothetical protein